VIEQFKQMSPERHQRAMERMPADMAEKLKNAM